MEFKYIKLKVISEQVALSFLSIGTILDCRKESVNEPQNL
jgi:hypothetical protein